MPKEGRPITKARGRITAGVKRAKIGGAAKRSKKRKAKKAKK